MKNYRNLFILGLLLSSFYFYSCQRETQETEVQQTAQEIEATPPEITEDLIVEFQNIVDKNNLNGSILIYDAQKEKYFSNDFERAETGFLPASTFKVTNSMIGIETGVLRDRNHMFKWDGEPRRLKTWEKDLTLAEAYKASCVPCYQEVARTIGVERMNEYLKKFEYGNIEIADSMIDMFWLQGDFKISQKQQIDFLKRFYNKSLPISDRTYNIMRKLMILDDNEEYTLSGKTGWAIRNGNNIGWFIGFVEKDDNLYYVATNVTPMDQNNTGDFARIRLKIALDALEQLGIL